ncbi:ArsR/SmtB family transcription factor [Halorubrum sp. DTA98]|uniref:ArsR/SmtB family transcription factor n=1 Tax=Halorubrum sp. DTA98 TaxID=3402163 RepID=UPI003AAB70B3
MPKLLPSRTDPDIDRSGDPSVLYVDDDRTKELVSTLASETTMDAFRRLNEDPLTASELSDDLDLSIQNASYHLDKLQEAGLIEVVDVCYSEKGREMNVYAVAREPLVLVLGTENDGPRVRKAFAGLAGVVGAPAIAIAAWRSVANLVDDVVGT